MPRLDEFVFAPDTEAERAYVIALGTPGLAAPELEEQMSEMCELVQTAGAEVIGSDVQRLAHPNPPSAAKEGGESSEACAVTSGSRPWSATMR